MLPPERVVRREGELLDGAGGRGGGEDDGARRAGGAGD